MPNVEECIARMRANADRTFKPYAEAMKIYAGISAATGVVDILDEDK